MSQGDIEVRPCGAIHKEDGVVCVRDVYYQRGCCSDKVYNHKGPHQHVDKDGKITHRWTLKLVVEDVPFDGYLPLEEDDDDL